MVENYTDLSHDTFVSEHLILEIISGINVNKRTFHSENNELYIFNFLSECFSFFYLSIVEFSDFLFSFLHNLMIE